MMAVMKNDLIELSTMELGETRRAAGGACRWRTVFDDIIEEKSFSKENGLNPWHFDHTKNRMVKEFNLLNAHYHAGEDSNHCRLSVDGKADSVY